MVTVSAMLREWLTREGVSVGEFAGRIGVHRVTMSRYLAGERLPRPHIMRRIQEATRGEITPNHWIGGPVSLAEGAAA